MSGPSPQHRQIAPVPSPKESGAPVIPAGESSPEESHRAPGDAAKKRVSMACLACKKSKRKCSGSHPCSNCVAFTRTCIFDETLDQRRRVAAKRQAFELSYHRDMLNDLMKVIRVEDKSYGLRLFDIIRNNARSEEIRAYIDETLARLGTGGKESETALTRLEDIRDVINTEGAGSSFRPKVMDINYLCDKVPYKVPARPWTKVTSDSDLVSHLVSIYFVWDYPLHAFLDRDVFLKHMAEGNTDSELCSPFLVNALLANACYFSDYSEAYVQPGDMVTIGTEFLKEAEDLKEEEPDKASLAYLQGTLLLYERYSMEGENDLGYKMLHQAIWTGELMGLIGPRPFRMGSVQVTEDMDISFRRTAWGLFHIDTVVHTNFLRPSLIDKVNLNRPPDMSKLDGTEEWVPYPSHRKARPTQLGHYFEYSSDLCEIARDISQRIFALNGASSLDHQRRTKEELYERLVRWYDALPERFDMETAPPPYILLLRMRYYTLIINMFSYTTQDESTVGTEAPKTPESEPHLSPPPKYNSDELVQSAAESIAVLTERHRQEYGMGRAHQCALYAITLALFTMMEKATFDILNIKFLTLASAFAVIADNSPLGKNMFYLFRKAARAKGQSHRIRGSSVVNYELKELFDDSSGSYSKWDDYGQGLEKLNRDERYGGIGDEEGKECNVFKMLDRYESLSLGKDEIAPERPRADDR